MACQKASPLEQRSPQPVRGETFAAESTAGMRGVWLAEWGRAQYCMQCCSCATLDAGAAMQPSGVAYPSFGPPCHPSCAALFVGGGGRVAAFQVPPSMVGRGLVGSLCYQHTTGASPTIRVDSGGEAGKRALHAVRALRCTTRGRAGGAVEPWHAQPHEAGSCQDQVCATPHASE
jgi:hypothetical protein